MILAITHEPIYLVAEEPPAPPVGLSNWFGMQGPWNAVRVQGRIKARYVGRHQVASRTADACPNEGT